jgi:hypothetical protein
VLRRFRTDDELGAIESMQALREVAPIELTCAKMIVANAFEGRSYAHLTLADLELLSDVPETGGVDFFTRRSREDAIIERKPYLLYIREPEGVGLVASTTPLDEPPPPPRWGSMSGPFEAVRDDVRRSAAAWPTELRIERDEPGRLLLHFLRARSG